MLTGEYKRRPTGPLTGSHGAEARPEQEIPFSAGSLRSVEFQTKRFPGWKSGIISVIGIIETVLTINSATVPSVSVAWLSSPAVISRLAAFQILFLCNLWHFNDRVS